tara:strand:+ start:1356 stop:1622 length:267 start_codon:yes stop_codon:yes gene_type:complete
MLQDIYIPEFCLTQLAALKSLHDPALLVLRPLIFAFAVSLTLLPAWNQSLLAHHQPQLVHHESEPDTDTHIQDKPALEHEHKNMRDTA